MNENSNPNKYPIYITIYVFSYLISQKNLKHNNALKTFENIIHGEHKNGLDKKIINDAKVKFNLKSDVFENQSNFLFSQDFLLA